MNQLAYNQFKSVGKSGKNPLEEYYLDVSETEYLKKRKQISLELMGLDAK
jgi:hypothetical protein